MPGLPGDLTGFDQLSSELGSVPGVATWYVPWSDGSAFPAAAAATVAAAGAVPEITWEPWDPAVGVSQPRYALARISAGAFDKYVRSWVLAIKSYGRPVRLRFAHEMNGTWYPWAEGVNGNAPGSYVAAWKHVRSVFTAARVTNVTWIWSPNVPFAGSVPLAQVFPGDAAVDELALDGYNWSTLRAGSTWTSFADVFGSGLGQLTAMSARPVTIGEVGCPEVGGDKGRWISDMWSTLTAWPQVRGMMWFDFDKETDWRIDSSPASLAAYQAGLPAYLAG
jgi:beta-mannanase